MAICGTAMNSAGSNERCVRARTLSLKRFFGSRGVVFVFCSVSMTLSQAEDRATQGCDPSVAWDPRTDGPASFHGVGLLFSVDLLLLSLWPNCDKPNAV